MGELTKVNLSIKEVEQLLEENCMICDSMVEKIKADNRKGVQKAFLKWEKKREKEQLLEENFQEMLKYEQKLRMENISLIAGIDEVGRGPLAGPVVAAAVVLPENFKLLGLTDSKKITKKNRETFYETITTEAVSIGIGVVSAEEIDRVNIYEATKIAMQRAINELSVTPEHLLIDAMQLPITIEQTSIIKGDSKSISIAASSIIAKVTRDRYMERLAEQLPHYGFDKHMGYGTVEHLNAIDQHGICVEHRKSFAPIRERCFTNTLF